MKLARKLVILIPIFLVAWISYLGAIIWAFGNKDIVGKADAAIVLGAAVYGDKPSPVYEARIQHAIELYQNGRVKKIIFTGGFGKGAKYSESQIGANYALSKGVKQTSIFTEAHSHTTKQNLIEAKRIMENNSIKNALIVSDPLHLRRASIMAKDIGLTATTSPAVNTKYQTLKSKIPFLFREIYFTNHYYLTGN